MGMCLPQAEFPQTNVPTRQSDLQLKPSDDQSQNQTLETFGHDDAGWVILGVVGEKKSNVYLYLLDFYTTTIWLLGHSFMGSLGEIQVQ